ncbi:MAG: YbaB/EbfC family nucleoid-associated protein [Streptosporangiales bacterium]|nr:YbaB/EbfC family nucleoid-associated protein [Streptosporangiales bacterium]
MTNPFEKGSAGPNPFGQGTPGPGPGAPDVPSRPVPSAPPASRPGPGGSGPGLATDTGSIGRARDAMNLDGRARDLKKAADGMRAAQERIAALAGVGTAADDKVRVTWAAATGLDQLHLDPRAMRMPSQELAAAIKQAITAAMTDLRRKTAEVMKEEAGVDAGNSTAAIQDLQDAFNSQMSEVNARVDQARRAMEQALRP